MKVVVSDFFSDSVLDTLRAAGVECHYDYTLRGVDLKALCQEEKPQVLLVRTTRITADIINAIAELELIVRAGTGTEGIDVAEACKRGVFVAHCPGKSADAVAELTMGLMCAIDRRLPENVALSREGKWRKRQDDGLFGKTLGIGGLGDIGQEVAARGRSFGLRLLGYDPLLDREQVEALGLTYCENLAILVTESDILTFHVPTVRQTRHLLTAEILSTCKPDAIIINTSRWDLVSDEDILTALESKPGLRYATDCHRIEPSEPLNEFSSKIIGHPRVFGTSHVGSCTRQADVASAEEAIRVILHYVSTREVFPRNCANRAIKTVANFTLAVRGTNEPGILAFTAQQLSAAGCSVQEVSNVVFDDAVACCANIDFVGERAVGEEVAKALTQRSGVVSAVCFEKVQVEEAEGQ